MADEEVLRDTQSIRRIVLKVGTNTLCDPDGRPDPELIAALAEDVHHLRHQGKQVLIISSGAIGAGLSRLHMPEMPQDIKVRQALAAVGQHLLMSAWDDAFRKRKTPVGQVLLTYRTFNDRRSYHNMRNCLEAILDLGAVPIINENDTVSIKEIDETFGDNDVLGALVAAKVEADLFVVLSDVQGLFDRPPQEGDANLLERVEEITEDVMAMAGAPGKNARGGMRSKLESARMLTEAGIPVVIAYGRSPGVLSAIAAGEAIGTWCEPVGHQDGRKRWLKAARPQGRILVDEGAMVAMKESHNLLPAGVVGVEGVFPVETVVDVVHEGKAVARVVSQLSSQDLEACKGMHSELAMEALGLASPVNVTRKGRVLLL